MLFFCICHCDHLRKEYFLLLINSVIVLLYYYSIFLAFVNDINKTLDEIDTMLYNEPEVMSMIEKWRDLMVTKISIAVYVGPNAGNHEHTDRPFHGFVINDETSDKEYCFSDGRVMRTEAGAVFYLPKGSTYYVKTLQSGGCYAINFDAEVDCQPFVVNFRDYEAILKPFRAAEREWRRQSDMRSVVAMRAVYDIAAQLLAEYQKAYVPDVHLQLIAPAVEKISASFAEDELSVAELAYLCGISEAYFRRIFVSKFGMSPKEYLIRLRISYAKQLLESGQFSVGEAASLSGYFEASHFSREFSKRVGVSPNEYKKRGGN